MNKQKMSQMILTSVMVVALTACQAQTANISESEPISVSTQQTAGAETVSETFEALSDGQERDWKIEDVLKNDLEIDGIPISIPCTVEELLNTLGEGYSVDESVFEEEKETYFSNLYYNKEKTLINISIIPEKDEENIFMVQGFGFIDNQTLSEKGVLGFNNLNETYFEIIKAYPNPNEIDFEDEKIMLLYCDEDYFFSCLFRNEKMVTFILSTNAGGNENDTGKNQ